MRAKGDIRKQQIINFILDFTTAHGMPPTLSEIARYMGVKSVGSLLASHIAPLEEEGYISRIQGRNSSIRVENPLYYSGPIPEKWRIPKYEPDPLLNRN